MNDCTQESIQKKSHSNCSEDVASEKEDYEPLCMSNFSASIYQRVSKKAAEVVFNLGIICSIYCCPCMYSKSGVKSCKISLQCRIRVVYRAQAVSFIKTISLAKSSLLAWMLEVEEVILGLGLPLLKFKLQADCQEIQSSLHCAYVHVILLSVYSTFGNLLLK